MIKWRDWGRTGLLLFVMVTVLTGCIGGGKAELNKELEEQITLKVTFWDEEIFYQQYGNLFTAQHPNIQFEVVPTDEVWLTPGKDPRELTAQFVKEHRPDVIMLEPYLFAPLIKEGLVQELDGMIQQDAFSLEGVLPAAIDQLRWMGDGKLYGLAPAFMEDAIYYNKDLFDEFGLPYPREGMSWDELLQLAGQFPTGGAAEDRVYGLQLYKRESGIDFMIRSGLQNGLRITDPSTGEMTLSTPSWIRTAEDALRYAKSDAVYKYDPLEAKEPETYEELLLQDLFFTKRIAMKVADSYYMSQLKNAQKMLKDEIITNWDIVAAPTTPDAPNESASFRLTDVFAVHAQSEHAQAAWEFVKYVNSEEFTKVTSRSSILNGLPVRTDYIRNDEGIHIEAFYTHSPARVIGTHYLEELRKLPESFVMSFYESLTKHWEAILTGELTIEEALLMIENEAQHVLDAAIEELEEKWEAES